MRCHVLNSRRARSISLATMCMRVSTCECNKVPVCVCVYMPKKREQSMQREPHMPERKRETVSNFDIELDISRRSFVVVRRVYACVCEYELYCSTFYDGINVRAC